MAIEGPIRELAASDLLQLLFVSRRTGRLRAVGGRGEEPVEIEIANGLLARARGGGNERRLGHLLVRVGAATEAQVAAALRRQQGRSTPPLGELLVADGAARPIDVERQLRFQIEATLLDLLRWTEGHLHFEERPPRPNGIVEIRLKTDMVLMEAVRRLDELAAVRADRDDPDPLPRLSARANASARPLSLSPLAWEVLGEVDGARTLREVARSLGRGELEVARAIHALADAGVVEIGEGGMGEGAVPASIGPPEGSERSRTERGRTEAEGASAGEAGRPGRTLSAEEAGR